MADLPPGLRQSHPGWTALLPGLIPALLFVAVQGMRRSYELIQATVASSRESTVMFFTLLDAHRDQILLGIAAMLIAGLTIARAIRRQVDNRRSPHQAR